MVLHFKKCHIQTENNRRQDSNKNNIAPHSKRRYIQSDNGVKQKQSNAKGGSIQLRVIKLRDGVKFIPDV